MPTLLPQDMDNNPIQALRLKDGGAHTITVSATSARNATAFAASTGVVSLYADTDVYVAFGDNTVAATTGDHFFPAGLYYDVSIGSERSGHDTHVAVIRSSADGNLYISEKE